MKWFVYVIRCGDGSLYTGIAVNVMKRLSAHQKGKGAKYTRGRKPLKVIHVEGPFEKGEALRRELEIKRMSKTQKETLCQSL